MIKGLSDSFTLANGVKMPCVGYGTYKTPDGEECAQGVKYALEVGYRHIDTAEFYGNEKGVGEGIVASGIDRKEIFVTTKIWNDNQGFDSTLRAFDNSLERLGLEYLDLYLIHWPIAYRFKDDYPKQFIETYRALEHLYKKGRVRAIGVCNCLKNHLNTLLENCEIKPMVNQIEYHVGYMPVEAERFSKENDIVVEGWSPLCKGRIFGFEPLKSIAEKHGKKESQVLVRWCLQHGVAPLPKSVHFDRIAENADIFDFELDEQDMLALDNFEGVGRLGSHPDTCNF